MKKRELKIIKKIQARAWGRFGKKLFITQPRNPVINRVIDQALRDKPDFVSEQKLKEMQAFKDSGFIGGTEKVEDPKTAKAMEEYVEKEIALAIKKGKLTDPTKSLKKTKQYAKRNKNKEGDN